MDPDYQLNPNKTTLLINAFKRFNVRSFADLGGCHLINGGYTLAALIHFQIDRAVLLDGRPTKLAYARAETFPTLEIIEGEFGNPDIVEKVGAVDAVLMFDILLHQADPDWRAILKLYCSQSRVVVIYNRQWTGSRRSLRLNDLGKDAYLHNTPGNFDEAGNLLPNRRQYFDNLDQIHPVQNRPYRDAWYWWQWGITDADLVDEMWANGFGLDSMANYGQSFGLPFFEDHGFTFYKCKPRPYDAIR